MKIPKILALKYKEKAPAFLCNFWWFKDTTDIICKDGVGCITHDPLARFHENILPMANRQPGLYIVRRKKHNLNKI